MKRTQKLLNSMTVMVLLIMFGVPKSNSYHFLGFIENMRQKSGLKYTIKYMKTVKLHITRYICGQPLKVNDSQVSLTNGFPTRFLYLKTLIDSNNYIKIRGVMTLLSYTRAITPTKEEEKKIKPSFNTITDRYKGKDYSIPMYFIKD